MIKRTLYFGNPAFLSLRNAQLVINIPNANGMDDASGKNTVPIEDIGIVVLDNKQITITHGVLESLLENNVALLTCDSNHMPAGLFLPLCGNTTQNERFRYQIDASTPLMKQLWQQTVQSKILNQAVVLKECRGTEVRNMFKWIDEVRSGDLDNMEARAAAYYWANLFSKFKRDREGEPPNNLLNYGYAILRATVARGLVSSGLIPTLGIHHHNRYNAYCLADDIMEPYRPFSDKLVLETIKEYPNIEELTKEIKTKLLSLSIIDVKINKQQRPLQIAMQDTASSLAQCFANERRKIKYPKYNGEI